jgi:hypothetical protein
MGLIFLRVRGGMGLSYFLGLGFGLGFGFIPRMARRNADPRSSLIGLVAIVFSYGLNTMIDMVLRWAVMPTSVSALVSIHA